MAVKPPTLIKQLDGSAKAGANCGMAASAMAVHFATQGYRKPSPTAMRKRAGEPSGPGDATNTANQERAVESFDGKGETNGDSDSTGGRKALVYHRKVQEPWSVAQEALDLGTKVVNVQIDYEVINKRAPSLSGDPGYTGDHSITLFGRRKTSTGARQVCVYDPLYDGRKKGIPKGPQWMSEAVMQEAAQKFSGKTGTFTGGVIPVSPSLTPQPPAPAPTPELPPPASAEDRYREALEEAQAIIDRALTPVVGIKDLVVLPGTSGEATEPPVTKKPEED